MCKILVFLSHSFGRRWSFAVGSNRIVAKITLLKLLWTYISCIYIYLLFCSYKKLCCLFIRWATRNKKNFLVYFFKWHLLPWKYISFICFVFTWVFGYGIEKRSLFMQPNEHWCWIFITYVNYISFQIFHLQLILKIHFMF